MRCWWFGKGASDATVLRILCLFTFLLILCTWPLWHGQHVFPQVPLLAGAVFWPGWVDDLAIAFALVSLLASIAVAPFARPRRLTLAIALAAFVILWIGDQHRLQPWAYHFALSAWLLASCPAPQNLRWLRLLMVSVYLFSALSKFDARFLQTYGVLFLEAGRQLVGRGDLPVSRDVLAHWAVVLPVGELVTGILLAVRRLRPWGLIAATVLHGSLIAILGPWGLNHRWGVLVWNIAFLTQVWLLFGPFRASGLSLPSLLPSTWWPASRRSRVALAPIVAALVLPLAEPLGVWDSWLAWGLYSTRAAKVELFLAREDAERLPDAVRSFCDADAPGSIWVRLAIDRWSLATLQAPIYPHERFQLGVGLAVVDLLPEGSRRVLSVRSAAPNRRTGATRTTRWEGAELMRREADAFFWNARPRRLFAVQSQREEDGVAGPTVRRGRFRALRQAAKIIASTSD